MDCLFCSIIAGDIPANKVYEDDKVLAFHDIHPQAPVHVLIIPKLHLASANEIAAGEAADAVAAVMCAVPVIAEKLGLSQGYRLITNVGEHGAQSVRHLHFHLLGGCQLPDHMGV